MPLTKLALPALALCCVLAVGEESQTPKETVTVKAGTEELVFRRVSPSKYGGEAADFYMLETEVTNRMFEKYLKANKLTKGDAAIFKKHKERKDELERKIKDGEPFTFTSSTIDAADHIIKAEWLWPDDKMPEKRGQYPVSFVTVLEAAAFCEWLTKLHPELGTFRLPKLEEWKIAAYGKDRSYPWGNDWDEARVRKSKDEQNEVKDFPNGRTPEGLYGIFGNVSEFIIHPSHVRNVTFINVGGRWAGGAFNEDEFKEKQTYWGYWHNSEGRSQEIGFRVLLDVTDKEHKFEHQVPYDMEQRQQE
ncbi:MAG TPA: SUMF1/EgtB/PvdO family nonheme iron enzyme [Planctomycetota bacterium]|nr:SUMF1/EgtB/PvdO family nonheme iron enzyme [Planctomycetota bacterium]